VGDDVGLQIMVKKMRKDVVNLGKKREGPLANTLAEVVQMAYAVNTIL
jgi:hypothetical protein